MGKELLSPIDCILSAAKLCNVSSIPIFPSIKLKKIKGIEMNKVASEEDAFSSAIGSLLSNQRTIIISNDFKPTEMIGKITSMRLPLICISFSSENAKFFKDSGWQVIFAESCQELMDRLIQGFKICEDNSVLVPMIIIFDMKNIREVVSTPSDKSIKKFVQKLNLQHSIKPKKITAVGVPIRNKDKIEFEMQYVSALENSLKMLESTNEKWKSMFRREHKNYDSFMMDDAEKIIVCAGPVSGTVKTVIEKMRAENKKVGAVIIKIFNPSSDYILKGKVSVLEKPMFGASGILHSEVSKKVNPIQYFMLKNPSEKDIENILNSEGEEKIYWVV